MDDKNEKNEFKLIRAKEASKILSISEPTFYRWQKIYPNFPPASKIGAKITLYQKSDVEAFRKWIFIQGLNSA